MRGTEEKQRNYEREVHLKEMENGSVKKEKVREFDFLSEQGREERKTKKGLRHFFKQRGGKLRKLHLLNAG